MPETMDNKFIPKSKLIEIKNDILAKDWDPSGYFEHLNKKWYQLEGYDDWQKNNVTQRDNATQKQESRDFWKDTVVGRWLSRAGSVLKETAEDFRGISERQRSGQQWLGQSLFQGAGALVGAGTGLVGEGIVTVGDASITAYDKIIPIKQAGKDIAGRLANSDIGKQALEALWQGMDKYNTRAENNPSAAANVEAAFDIASVVPVGKAGQMVGRWLGKAKQAASKWVSTAAKAVWFDKKLADVAGSLENKLRESARANIELALNPTKARTKQLTQKISWEFGEKQIGGSLQSIKETAEKGREQRWQAIGEYLEKNTIQWNVGTKNLNSMFDDINSIYNPWDKVVNPQIQSVTDTFKSILTQYWDDIPWQEAKALMKAWDNVVYSTKWSLQTSDMAMANQFRKKGADHIRKVLAEANPDLSKLNKEFSFYSNLAEVVDSTLQRKTWQKGWLETLAWVAGAAWGIAAWGVLPTVVSGLWLRNLISLTKSARWNTLSAKLKNRIANMISKGNKKWAEKAINEAAKKLNIEPISKDKVQEALWVWISLAKTDSVQE